MAAIVGLASAASSAVAGASGFLKVLALAGSVATSLAANSARNRALEADAKAQEFNAKINENRAKEEKDNARAEAEDFRRKQSFRRSTAIADRAASGVRLEGTPLLVDEDIVAEIELGAARIGNKGQRRATGFENQASLDRFSAKNSRAAKRGPGISLLGGIAQGIS